MAITPAGWMNALAKSAPVPVYCLLGDGPQLRTRLRQLRLDSRLRFVRTPRQAFVLLVAGGLPESWRQAAQRVHDQLPRAAGVVHWTASSDDESRWFDHEETVPLDQSPVPRMRNVMQEMLNGSRPPMPRFGPSSNPVDWQGTGDHGQGGEGMMGGVPYGRAMAMTGDDIRDGLQLDNVPLEIGPFLPWMPAGLRFQVTLQGDVIQQLTPLLDPPRDPDLPAVWTDESYDDLPAAELYVSRARHQLEAVSDLLALLELDALAERVIRLAGKLRPGDGHRVRNLARALRLGGGLDLATRGIGRLPAPDTAKHGEDGPGIRESHADGLSDPPFSLLERDVKARWSWRLDDAARALDEAAQAGDRLLPAHDRPDGPRGPLPDRYSRTALKRLVQHASGMAWDEFVTTLVSLDIDSAALPPLVEADEGDHDDDSEAHGHHHHHGGGH